jgi:hypothetical protein
MSSNDEKTTYTIAQLKQYARQIEEKITSSSEFLTTLFQQIRKNVLADENEDKFSYATRIAPFIECVVDAWYNFTDFKGYVNDKVGLLGDIQKEWEKCYFGKDDYGWNQNNKQLAVYNLFGCMYHKVFATRSPPSLLDMFEDHKLSSLADIIVLEGIIFGKTENRHKTLFLKELDALMVTFLNSPCGTGFMRQDNVTNLVDTFSMNYMWIPGLDLEDLDSHDAWKDPKILDDHQRYGLWTEDMANRIRTHWEICSQKWNGFQSRRKI